MELEYVRENVFGLVVHARNVHPDDAVAALEQCRQLVDGFRLDAGCGNQQYVHAAHIPRSCHGRPRRRPAGDLGLTCCPKATSGRSRLTNIEASRAIQPTVDSPPKMILKLWASQVLCPRSPLCG